MPLQTGNNRHITFDEDEDFESIPALEPLRKDSDGEVEEETVEASDSDSDAAPEEVTITAGKEEAQKREDRVRSSVDKHRQQIKEKRKQQHEKNKLQQEEKRKRLEERRLPQSLLDAVAAEQKTKSLQRERGLPTKKKKKKIKTFNDSDEHDGSVEPVDEEGLITIDTGVKVRTLNEETKKYNELSRRATEFRMNALYGKNTKRMPSSQLREMKVKQMKSGKAVFGIMKA